MRTSRSTTLMAAGGLHTWLCRHRDKAMTQGRERPITKNLAALVVDDDPDMIEIVSFVLREIGILNITRATSAMNALEHFKDRPFPFDLIICDWMMPGMNGLDFLRHVRTHDRETPFLMLTSRSRKADVVAAKSAGVTAYIAKPFASAELRQKVLALVEPFVHK
jgi:two-component system chemotaxis response regulator CheY